MSYIILQSQNFQINILISNLLSGEIFFVFKFSTFIIFS